MSSITGKSVGRILSLATDRRVISWPVISVCAVLSVLIHLAPNGGTVEGSVWVRIAAAIVAYLPALGVIALAAQLTKNWSRRRLATAVMLVSFFLGGALRGVVLAVAFYSLHMASSLNLDFRIPGSAIPFGLAIAAATYAASALDESKTRIASLHALEEELNQAVTDSYGRESQLREKALSRIEESVSAELARVGSIVETTTVDELRSLAADVVRPLSHRLAERIPQWRASDQRPARIRWRDILGQIRPELSLRPTLLTVLVVATGLTAFVYFFGAANAIPLILCSAVLLYGSIWVLQLVSRRLNAISNWILRAVVMTALLMIAAIPAGLVGDLIVHNAPDPTFLFRAGLILVPIFGWFIALGGAAQAESLRVEDQINEGINRLSWLKARLNLINWHEQGEFARVLHGPVQSAINKGIIRLGQSPSGISPADILKDVRTEIDRALEPTLRWEGQAKAFEDLCRELAQTWAEVCQIDLSLSPGAKHALASDAPCATLCWDIVHESCSNAIRHGGASWISIRVSEPAERELPLEVIDNGTPAESSAQPGLGSSMLDACSLRWNRARQTSQTVLTTSLPILSNTLAQESAEG
jgi:two-component sensor histidine kinase